MAQKTFESEGSCSRLAERGPDVSQVVFCSIERGSGGFLFLDDGRVLQRTGKQTTVCRNDGDGLDAALDLYAGIRTGLLLDSGSLQLFLEHGIFLVYHMAHPTSGTAGGKTPTQRPAAFAADICCRGLVGAYFIRHADDPVSAPSPKLGASTSFSKSGSSSAAQRLCGLPLPDAGAFRKALSASA